MEARGQFKSDAFPAITEKVECEDGVAVAVEDDPKHTFRCSNVSALSNRDEAD